MTNQPLHKIFLLADKVKIPLPSKKKHKLVLPAIRFLSGKEFDGLFVLSDGGLRQIIRCNGINPIYNNERATALEQELAKFLLHSDCALQMVLVSRPFNLDHYRRELRPLTKHENAYLNWYADYSDKWLRRVIETMPIPNKEFFIVITQAGKFSVSANKRLSKAESNQIALLEKNRSKLLKLLKSFELLPAAANKCQTRTILASNLFAPSDSDAFLLAEPPESLGDSTICEPEFTASDRQLTVGDLKMRNYYLSQLPAANWMGWLVDSVLLSYPITVSVHIKPCSQTEVRQKIRQRLNASSNEPSLQLILEGRDKAVDVSLYVSTYLGGLEADYPQEEANEFLRKRGATLKEAKGNQIEAFRSAIPLGLDALSVTHRLSSTVAAACWPLFTALENKAVGHLIGFALQSREPVFLEARSPVNTLIAGGSKETTESICTLIALRYLGTGSRVLYIGNSDSIQFLGKMLGVEASGEFAFEKLGFKIEGGRFLYLAMATELLDQASLDNLSQFCHYAEEHNLAICIEESAPFLKSVRGREFLQKIIEFTSAKKIQLFIGAHAASAANKQFVQFAAECPVKIIVPQDNKESFLKEMQISKAQTEVAECNKCAILKTSSGASHIRLVNSPIDTYIAPDPLWNVGASTQALVAHRASMIQNCKDKNPKLSETDAIRQGIYYAGMQPLVE